MEHNKSSNEMPEQVIIFPDTRIIKINNACPERAYALFDAKTGVQTTAFVKGIDGQIEFKNLDPNRHFDVGVVQNMGDEKPEFAIIWTLPMRDDTDAILQNSDNLPVVFPRVYTIADNNKSDNNNLFNLVDAHKDVVAQVAKLTPTNDKLKFKQAWTFKMVDNAKK